MSTGSFSRCCVGLLAVVLLCTAQAAPRRVRPKLSDDSVAGTTLYEKGTLADGSPLVALRADAPALSGANAACINCHRKSGLGSIEARNVIPPVTGRYLFHPPQDSEDAARLPYLPNSRLDRAAYTRETLAAAIREGTDASGKPLSYLMPRYDLSDTDMDALITHLVALDPKRVPGVNSEELHFATIVTPDADPLVREGVLNVIRNFFDEKNAAPRVAGGQKLQTSAKGAQAKHMLKVGRLWVLHVWELTGPASTWQQQLKDKMAAEPVFAVISGAYGGNFVPVRDFCEAEAVPCLFPNLDNAPADGDGDFHTVYFSRGVGVEADLVAQDIVQSGSSGPIFAIYREGDVGQVAAQELQARLQAQGMTLQMRSLSAQADPAAVRALLTKVPAQATVALWLRPTDLAAVGSAPKKAVYVSGIMGDYENAPVPSEWRAVTKLLYNIDLPEERRVRLDYAHGWFRVRRIPEIAFRQQADTMLACGILSETVKHLIDAFIPDYLVERIEDTLEHRLLTGNYARLSLGPRQRYAVKGGYFARFTEPTGSRVERLGDWMYP
jgi:hypothetical protein